MHAVPCNTTGGACFAEGPETLGKGFAEGCPRQRPLGKFLDGEGVFAEGPLSGPRQRKEPVTRWRRWRFLCRGPTLGKEMVFLKFFLPRAGPRQRIFFKSLPRASSLALGKEIFRIFPKKTFAEGYCKGPRQRFFKKKIVY